MLPVWGGGGAIQGGAYFRNFTVSTDFCTQGNVSSELASLGSFFFSGLRCKSFEYLKVHKNKEKPGREKDSVVTSESTKEQFEIFLLSLIHAIYIILFSSILDFSVFHFQVVLFTKHSTTEKLTTFREDKFSGNPVSISSLNLLSTIVPLISNVSSEIGLPLSNKTFTNS